MLAEERRESPSALGALADFMGWRGQLGCWVRRQSWASHEWWRGGKGGTRHWSMRGLDSLLHVPARTVLKPTTRRNTRGDGVQLTGSLAHWAAEGTRI
jgi:hypothetical protein